MKFSDYLCVVPPGRKVEEFQIEDTPKKSESEDHIQLQFLYNQIYDKDLIHKVKAALKYHFVHYKGKKEDFLFFVETKVVRLFDCFLKESIEKWKDSAVVKELIKEWVEEEKAKLQKTLKEDAENSDDQEMPGIVLKRDMITLLFYLLRKNGLINIKSNGKFSKVIQSLTGFSAEQIEGDLSEAGIENILVRRKPDRTKKNLLALIDILEKILERLKNELKLIK